MYKACSRCGKIHDSRFNCNVNKVFTGGIEREMRSRNVWTKKSQEIRERANYLCEVCRDKGAYTYEGLEVHHIEKIVDRQDMFLDDQNLICLCVEHHKQADRGDLSKDYLRSLVQRRE